MNLLKCERGASTAEFAILVPIIAMVVAIVVTALVLSGTRVALVAGAHDIARLEARGDTTLAATRESRLPPGAVVVREQRGQLLCIEVSFAQRTGVLAALRVTGEGCALVSQETA
ncbi:TadE/TadG family type IV pilus assembly protein [Leucobacter chinensis]|uniref:TadE/TadG family type IV pilus assembly protein n=1 Tax=Leucobacter chinensis TaxID=2851010 RepID=UPI001C22F5DB|nr:pilus assembly protein [Leucobacter chinensis]